MIPKFSVRKPYTVLVAVILVIILGVVSVTKMTTDLLPSINLPYVVVMTTYAGASPETVEIVVTKPIESSMATVSNIENVSSVSNENYSMVILEFTQTADMDSVSLEIRENLDQLKTYWDDSVSNPIIMKLNPTMLPVMIAAVGVEGMDNVEVSEYVDSHVVSELESLEGVASVSTVGLVDESINVIIRQEKIDELNEKIYASIDSKMADARQELEDGREEIKKQQSELAKGETELSNGQTKLDEGRTQLEDGKKQLESQQTATAKQLAEAENKLLTAKADLEAAKITATTEIATITQLSEGLAQAQTGLANLTTMSGYATEYPTSSDARALEIRAALISTGNFDETTVQSEADWIIPGRNNPYVLGILSSVSSGAASQISTVEAQIDNLEASINAKTGSMGAAQYLTLQNTQLATINSNIATVDNGLLELSKGKLTASIQFSNAGTEIALGKYQLEASQTELDSAKEQINSAKEQIQDALDQITDGEEQLDEAAQDAYDQADMNGIITIDIVKSLLTAQNFSMPAGYVTEDGIDYMVRLGDKPATLEEMEEIPLMNLHLDGVDVITLADVADVFYTDNSGEVYTNINGNAGVMLTIQKQTGYSTGDVSDKLTTRFEEMMDTNEDLNMITLMDQGIYIDLVVDSVVNNVLIGALLAIVILIFFLKDIKPTFIIACSIPISLVAAIVCMYFSGVTLNIISLSGLALGIGMLVDNSIVVIENIYRLRAEGYSKREAAVEGAKEVSGAIVASTLTTICVFAPIVFTEGITRQLFVDMGLTIAYSLVASLAIALTVVPAMASKMLTKTKSINDSKLLTAITKGYGHVLEACLKIKPLIIIAVFALLAVSFFAAQTNGTAFMPEMDSTQLTVNVELEKGSTMQETAEVTDTFIERISKLEDIEDVGAMSGGSTMSLLGGSSSDNSATIYITTKEKKSMTNEELAQTIAAEGQDLDATITVDTSTMDMSALGGSGVSIEVRGRDLDELQRIAGEVAFIVNTVDGTTNVSDGLEETSEELRISIDKDKAMEYGLTVAQVYTQIQPKLADATQASTLTASDKDYGIYVSSEKDNELTRELIRSLNVEGTNADGETVEVPLKDIVTFETAESLTSISRTEQTRYISVTAEIADGYNVGLVSEDINEALEDYELPSGYSLEFAGENETINDALEQLELMLLLAIAFMYLIMVAQFQSLLHPFIIMFTVPLAFTGGLFGLFFTNNEISVISVIGFVMLAGIIVNNGIVLIDYINQLRKQGMEKKEAIISACKTRLRPVLMTALTTILAMSTMVFSQNMGSDMTRPMAIVTIGGLVYGTLLTLVVVPCVYDLIVRDHKKTGLNVEVQDGENE